MPHTVQGWGESSRWRTGLITAGQMGKEGDRGHLPRVTSPFAKVAQASRRAAPPLSPDQDISFPLTPVAEEAGCAFERRQLLAETFVSEFPSCGWGLRTQRLTVGLSCVCVCVCVCVCI